MDQEVKRALANIRRRKQEISRKYGPTEDDGPLFDKSRAANRSRLELEAEWEVEELEDDWEDNLAR